MRNLLFFIFIASLSACSTYNKVVQIDKTTGYFPTNKSATVVKSIDRNLDAFKGLILVPTGGFTRDMVTNIGYFDKVITFEDLEVILVQENLADTVPSLDNKLGVNKAAKAYQQFLWLRWDSRREENNRYSQLILTDPISLEDIFIGETYVDVVWNGVSDQANFYPMMNALVDYIKSNSSSYQ